MREQSNIVNAQKKWRRYTNYRPNRRPIVKTAILVILIVILLSSASFASFVATETNLRANITTIKICVQQPLGTDGFGAFAFGSQNRYYGQAYAGLTYFKPGKVNVEVAAGFGTEQDPNPNRFGGWLWAGKDKLSATYVYENGGSGVFDKLEVKYQTTSRIAIGWINQDFSGQGPLVEYKLGSNFAAKFYATNESHSLLFTQNF